MKIIKQLVIASVLSTMVASPSFGAEKADYAHVRVSFHEPSQYTDIDFDGSNTEKGNQIVLDHIRSVFIETADNWLPPSYTLEVTVFDIDMAGEYEPERGATFPRIVKDIYMPMIQFDYRVLDPDGEVVREGSETLRNSNFLQNPARAVRANSEVAYDVSSLIRDWGAKIKREDLA